MIPLEDYIAGELYTQYVISVGGKAFNGDQLPTWDEIYTSESETKQKIANAWIETAKKAIELLQDN